MITKNFLVKQDVLIDNENGITTAITEAVIDDRNKNNPKTLAYYVQTSNGGASYGDVLPKATLLHIHQWVEENLIDEDGEYK